MPDLDTSLTIDTFMGSADQPAARSNLGLVIGTNIVGFNGALGTPLSGSAANLTGYATSNLSGLGTNVVTALSVSIGSAGAVVVNGGVLGTPSSGTVTNLTGTASININGTVGATTPNTVDATNVTVSGNLTLTGTGSRILAPLSSATPASRSVFQSSTVNTMTLVTAAPNGSNTTSGFEFHDSSALTGSIGSVYIDGTAVRIFSGGSVVKPIDIRLSTSTTARFYPSGGVRIGTTLSDPGANNLSVQGIATVAGIIDSGKVITPAGTTGARTINAMTGSVNLAAGATSLVVTNSLVTTSSTVVPTPGNDTTAKSISAVCAAGSFTLRPNAASTVELPVGFLVIN